MYLYQKRILTTHWSIAAAASFTHTHTHKYVSSHAQQLLPSQENGTVGA